MERKNSAYSPQFMKNRVAHVDSRLSFPEDVLYLSTSFCSWDTAYKLELDNYKDHGDVGEVWFGEDSALRVIR